MISSSETTSGGEIAALMVRVSLALPAQLFESGRSGFDTANPNK